MNKNEHIVIADSEGRFYCRAVDGMLNYKKDEQVCGRGCPCYVMCRDGRFICRYEDKGMEERPALFPIVGGLAPGLSKAYEYAAKAHSGLYHGTDRRHRGAAGCDSA